MFAALKNIAATLLASGKTRLELFANELEEEKLRAFQMLVMALGMVFCLGAGMLILILFLTVLFWESRVLVLGHLVRHASAVRRVVFFRIQACDAATREDVRREHCRT